MLRCQLPRETVANYFRETRHRHRLHETAVQRLFTTPSHRISTPTSSYQDRSDRRWLLFTKAERVNAHVGTLRKDREGI